MITRKDLIKKYLDFFKSKNHKEIPNASLIPENDPTVLFTTAGMHPLVPYLLGQKHLSGKRLCNVQKCIRTGDIDEVGDDVHLTFFEMLGNWSLGDYFKKEAIAYSLEFLTKILKIPQEEISVTCFKGEGNILKDEESAKIWKDLGISKIKFLSKEDNWWGPAGNTGPCGPDTEMFVNGVEIWNDVFMQYNKKFRDIILVDAIHCLIDKEKGVNIELADFLRSLRDNSAVRIIIVTNAPKEEIKEKIKPYNFEIFTLEKDPDKTNPEYFKKMIQRYNWIDSEKRIIYFDHSKENIESAKKAGINLVKWYKNDAEIKKWINENISIYIPLSQKNVDTGMGVERTISILQKKDIFETETFLPIIKKIEELSKKSYEQNKRAMRIIADHIKASVFIIADGISPSNTEQGYVLRRLIRRAVRYGMELGIRNFIPRVAESAFKIYDDYRHLQNKKQFILSELEREEKKFLETLERGMNQFKKFISNKKLSGKEAFLLYQSYGFPIEMIEEECKKNKINFKKKDFQEELAKHQELSRTATKGKFKSGLADHSEQTTKLHTAAHLFLSALRIVLKDESIIQRGSNITPERLRLDFSFNRALTSEEVKKTEDLVNKEINKSQAVIREEMSPQEAKKKGASGIFDSKYGERVSVYTIGNFSKEICAGPHVKNTKEIGHFKIIKEESSSSGVRRIKAVVN